MDYPNGTLGYGGAYGVKTAYPNTAIESTGSVIREATEAVRAAQKRVDEVTLRLRNINDEAFGAIPSKDASGLTAIATSASKADDLRRATSALHDTLNYLEAEVNRLGQL